MCKKRWPEHSPFPSDWSSPSLKHLLLATSLIAPGWLGALPGAKSPVICPLTHHSCGSQPGGGGDGLGAGGRLGAAMRGCMEAYLLGDVLRGWGGVENWWQRGVERESGWTLAMSLGGEATTTCKSYFDHVTFQTFHGKYKKVHAKMLKSWCCGFNWITTYSYACYLNGNKWIRRLWVPSAIENCSVGHYTSLA